MTDLRILEMSSNPSLPASGPAPGAQCAQKARGALSRRSFLASTTVATTFMVLPGCVLGRSGHESPNNKLNIAGIGIGGQGAGDLDQFSSENIVALCDVDSAYAAKTFEKYPKAKRYKDFRKMLEAEKSIDAVVIATPDHTHAIISMAALKMGKHVYCEKPLTHTVHEARAVATAARAAKVATQMGNQGMAFEGNRLINEWLQDGAIGPVHEVHVWSDRPTHRGKLPLWWAQGIERPKDTPPVPGSSGLGPLARAGSLAPLPPRLRSVPLARLVGLRLRWPRGHGHP